MNDIIIYLLNTAVILSVLYSVYWLFLRKDTFFNVNRFYLISVLILSAVVPLIDIRLPGYRQDSVVAIMLETVTITPEKIEKVSSGHLSFFEIVGIVYITGVAIFSMKLIIQIVQLWLIIRKFKITRQDGANLVFTDKGYSPFSFFNLIFIRKDYYIDGKLTPVIAHELVHIRQFHTIDLLLAEMILIIQWFNPFAWLLARSLKSVHEFLADEGVLRKGFLKNEYQMLILNEAMGLQVNNLTNYFNVSLTKKRIQMMTKTRTASWALIKVGFALPAFFAVIFLFTAGSINQAAAQDSQQKQKQQQAEEQKALQESQPGEEQVFMVVEKMPEFPGGTDAMINYLVSNIKYPQEARTKGIQGRVFVTFIVEKDGTISNVKILRGVDPALDAEALRVVSAMPKWSPGMQKEKPVRVQFNLPISFSLEEKKAPEKTPEEK